MRHLFSPAPAPRRASGCRARFALIAASTLFAVAASADTTLRIATYNINADTSDYAKNGVPPEPYLKTLLSGINSAHLAGNAQPLDVLVLQELNGTPSVTLQAIVNDLNSLPGVAPGTYAYDTSVYTQSGYDPTGTGNGPSGLIYNTKTVKEVSSPHYVGTVSTSGAAREPVRYELQPVNYNSAADFYVYVDHYKADSGYQTRRNVEAQAVRADADALPANSHIIFAGDFNLTGGSSEPAYQTLTAAGGNGQAFDPLTSTFSADSSSASNVKLYTESATNLSARFDFQLDSAAVLPQNHQPGLELVPGTYTAFGNSYYAADGTLSSTMTYKGSVTDSSNTGPLTDLGSSRSSVLTALADVSDHLPVVADYTITGLTPLPEPASVAIPTVIGLLALRRRRQSLPPTA